MNEFVRQFLFKYEIEHDFNLTGKEWIYFLIKFILSVGFSTFLFVLGANIWLTLFGVDFQFTWWSALLIIFLVAIISKRGGLIISVTVGVTGLLLYPFI